MDYREILTANLTSAAGIFGTADWREEICQSIDTDIAAVERDEHKGKYFRRVAAGKFVVGLHYWYEPLRFEGQGSAKSVSAKVAVETLNAYKEALRDGYFDKQYDAIEKRKNTERANNILQNAA